MLLGGSRAKVLYKGCRLTHFLTQLQLGVSREAASVGAVYVLTADLSFLRNYKNVFATSV